MKFNIAICDDDIMSLNKIEDFIRLYFSNDNTEYTVNKFPSGEKLIEQNSLDFPYNLIFLDIKMNELSGLDVARKIREQSQQVVIVFITSYIDFALAGYKVDAARYILKNSSSFQLEFDECMNAVMKKYRLNDRIQRYEFQNGSRDVHINRIVYIESSLHKVIFHIEEKDKVATYYLYAKLDDIESELPDANFCRVHKSFLVNLKYARKIERYMLTLYDGGIINISKKRYAETKDSFMLYKGRE
jgi:DNA-binding LytR/AlgR family response regulator